jgi:secondary thiamine-phosphate synthase enzyme
MCYVQSALIYLEIRSINMTNIKFFTRQIQADTEKGISIVDITDQITEVVRDSKIQTGSLHATCIGSTGSLTCIEYEPGVVKDLAGTINALAPPGMKYEHEKAWHDGNGHSHVQAAIIGPSIVIPVRSGRCALGTWQQAVLINHDTRPRTRKVEISIMGIV